MTVFFVLKQALHNGPESSTTKLKSGYPRKDQESAVSDVFDESLIFCPKLALGRLFSFKNLIQKFQRFCLLGKFGKK